MNSLMNDFRSSMDRLKELLLQNWVRPATETLDSLEEAVRVHLGSEQQADDITMIAFRRL